jgi:hypothetical protein
MANTCALVARLPAVAGGFGDAASIISRSRGHHARRAGPECVAAADDMDAHDDAPFIGRAAR